MLQPPISYALTILSSHALAFNTKLGLAGKKRRSLASRQLAYSYPKRVWLPLTYEFADLPAARVRTLPRHTVSSRQTLSCIAALGDDNIAASSSLHIIYTTHSYFIFFLLFLTVIRLLRDSRFHTSSTPPFVWPGLAQVCNRDTHIPLNTLFIHNRALYLLVHTSSNPPRPFVCSGLAL